MRIIARNWASRRVDTFLENFLRGCPKPGNRPIRVSIWKRQPSGQKRCCRWVGPTNTGPQIFLAFALLCASLVIAPFTRAEGITPEQIFQPVIDWNSLIGTWEVLPEGSPLEEKSKGNDQASDRTLMTLRVDGTCRIFDKAHPHGSDGLWTFEDHEMFITFKNAAGIDFYIYGVKSGFMVTRSPIKGGRDQLWSKIK